MDSLVWVNATNKLLSYNPGFHNNTMSKASYTTSIAYMVVHCLSAHGSG